MHKLFRVGCPRLLSSCAICFYQILPNLNCDLALIMWSIMSDHLMLAWWHQHCVMSPWLQESASGWIFLLLRQCWPGVAPSSLSWDTPSQPFPHIRVGRLVLYWPVWTGWDLWDLYVWVCGCVGVCIIVCMWISSLLPGLFSPLIYARTSGDMQWHQADTWGQCPKKHFKQWYWCCFWLL